ncbi:hypothetical protein CH293_18565 [Rhodococcus sp. 14-2470-1b]|nr:hypothetical protein CH293_18565 [Rhodococcus sp. 14-2470-1b]
MFWRRLKKRVIVPKVVLSELENISIKNDFLALAAKSVLSKGMRSLLLSQGSHAFSGVDRKAVRELIIAEELRSASAQCREAKTSGHDGEIDVILLASAGHDKIVFTNDNAALNVAKNEYKLSTAVFATLMAAEIADGNLLAEEAAEVLLGLQERNLYPGVHNITALNLVSLHVPDGF